MKFRPCIDLRGGKVTQIVGSTLVDAAADDPSGSSASAATNFVTDRSPASYARMYARDGLVGGHVILLGPGNADAAREALAAYPAGLQVGGGVTPATARSWIDAGASHVIVTSYAFCDGTVDASRLAALVEAAGGRERVVLDLSCRRRPGEGPEGAYYVVTDRWQTFTDVVVDKETLDTLAGYCAEFLVHGVEAEGKRCGILEDLVEMLGRESPIPVTYAGGARGMEDLERVKVLGKGKVDLTIGTALDCFGGDTSYDEVVLWHKKENPEV